ncbi:MULTISPECIES: 4a-hydroxytetrahydrobiopterin dehydratase [Hydrocarboniphaga]|uniref:4a-hydroxytetrahydrobiopterin dehydratase n=1 Tax=Hydrocarboniphaga effusa AP103 TaxID=1172194 RepID=I8T6T0_9GAMM|nr:MULTISPECIES: 4a-hydroxytetrahydrobiopterin dehydratase [Hydrocarboniphaga]EIT69640.1 pterin-4-alpha-carbinolamine dehydratase [Hydrocarboniphaga effusa AP103]MDZ4080049.1 4a-hydroxytetrahydrobiopterin dehydratase [Hydrocarboniphaga sp.]
MAQLSEKKCVPCEGGVPPLDLAAAIRLHEQLNERWKIVDQGRAIETKIEFRTYARVLAFTNAVAWIAIQEDHHPLIEFGYQEVRIRYWTHAIDGLSENDFICAAKIDRLLAE